MGTGHSGFGGKIHVAQNIYILLSAVCQSRLPVAWIQTLWRKSSALDTVSLLAFTIKMSVLDQYSTDKLYLCCVASHSPLIILYITPCVFLSLPGTPCILKTGTNRTGPMYKKSFYMCSKVSSPCDFVEKSK